MWSILLRSKHYAQCSTMYIYGHCPYMYYFLLSIIWIAPFSDAVRSKDVDRNFAKCSIHARRTKRRYRLWNLKHTHYTCSEKRRLVHLKRRAVYAKWMARRKVVRIGPPPPRVYCDLKPKFYQRKFHWFFTPRIKTYKLVCTYQICIH